MTVDVIASAMSYPLFLLAYFLQLKFLATKIMDEHKKQTSLMPPSLRPPFSICVYLSVNVSESFVPPLPVALRIVYI